MSHDIQRKISLSYNERLHVNIKRRLYACVCSVIKSPYLRNSEADPFFMFSMLLLALSPIYLEELCKGPATLYDSRQLDTAVVDFVSTTVYDYQSYIFPNDFPS